MIFCEMCGENNSSSNKLCKNCGNYLLVDTTEVHEIEEDFLKKDVKLYPPTNQNRANRTDFVSVVSTPIGKTVVRKEDIIIPESTDSDVNRYAYITELTVNNIFKGVIRLYIKLFKFILPIFSIFYILVLYNVKFIYKFTPIVSTESLADLFLISAILLIFIPLSILLPIIWNYNLGNDISEGVKLSLSIKNLVSYFIFSLILSGLVFSSYYYRLAYPEQNAIWIGIIIISYFSISKIIIAPGFIHTGDDLITSLSKSWQVSGMYTFTLLFWLIILYLIPLILTSSLRLLFSFYLENSFSFLSILFQMLVFPIFVLTMPVIHLAHYEINGKIKNGILWSSE